MYLPAFMHASLHAQVSAFEQSQNQLQRFYNKVRRGMKSKSHAGTHSEMPRIPSGHFHEAGALTFASRTVARLVFKGGRIGKKLRLQHRARIFNG